MPIKAQEVFVPGAYPQHTYVEREGARLEQSLRDALDTPGQVISLSGPSKSGKTVLVERVVGRDYLITMTGASIESPDDIWNYVLDWIDAPTSLSSSHSRSGSFNFSTTGKGTVGVPLIASGEVGGSASGEVEAGTEAEEVRIGVV